MSETAQTVVTTDNTTYHVTLSGPKNGPLVLLTHALMSNSHMWDSTVHALHAANYRTLRFDHIGHNCSPPTDPSRSYSTEDIMQHMREIVQQVTTSTGTDVKLKAVVGCSIGGMLALRYGMLYPSDVEVVISLCAPGIKSLEEAKPLWTSRIAQFETDLESGSEYLCHATVKRWLPGNSAHDEAVRAEALGHVRTCTLQGYRVLADAIRGYDYDSADELEKLSGVKQVVVVAGGRDGASSPELLRSVAERIEGARFVLMEEAGHIPPMHRAKEFEEMMLEVLGDSQG